MYDGTTFAGYFTGESGRPVNRDTTGLFNNTGMLFTIRRPIEINGCLIYKNGAIRGPFQTTETIRR